MQKQIILVTGAGTGIGKLSAQSLAEAGHRRLRVDARHRGPQCRPRRRTALARCGEEHSAPPARTRRARRTPADAAAATIVREQGHLDVVMQNAGHLVVGPTEAFTPEEIVKVFDTNVLGAQRVNRAVLPYLRRQESGLMLWISSHHQGRLSAVHGPYGAAKAAMDRWPSRWPTRSRASASRLPSSCRAPSPGHRPLPERGYQDRHSPEQLDGPAVPRVAGRVCGRRAQRVGCGGRHFELDEG